MPIKFKGRNLNHPLLIRAASQLRNAPLKAKAAYDVSKICRKLDGEMKNLSELHRNLLEQMGVKKDDGTFEMDDKNEFVIKEGFTKEDYHKAFDELMDVDMEIPCSPITIEVLDGMSLTANEINALDFIFAENQEATVTELKPV